MGGWKEVEGDDMGTALELLWLSLSWTISRENSVSLVLLIAVMAEPATKWQTTATANKPLSVSQLVVPNDAVQEQHVHCLPLALALSFL